MTGRTVIIVLAGRIALGNFFTAGAFIGTA